MRFVNRSALFLLINASASSLPLRRFCKPPRVLRCLTFHQCRACLGQNCGWRYRYAYVLIADGISLHWIGGSIVIWAD